MNKILRSVTGGGSRLFKHSLAFTLAEVLITLGIIGVVAAITMPALMTQCKRIILKNQFEKARSELFQAIKLWQQDEDEDLYSTYYNDTDQNGVALRAAFYSHLKGTPNKSIPNDQLKPYLTSAKGSKQTIHQCPPSSCRHPYIDGFTTLEGVMFVVSARDNNINFAVDINGYDKGPNKWGVDLFDWDYKADNTLTHDYKAYYCGAYTHKTDSGAGTSNDGLACTAYAEKDQDYFKRIDL